MLRGIDTEFVYLYFLYRPMDSVFEVAEINFGYLFRYGLFTAHKLRAHLFTHVEHRRTVCVELVEHIQRIRHGIRHALALLYAPEYRNRQHIVAAV